MTLNRSPTTGRYVENALPGAGPPSSTEVARGALVVPSPPERFFAPGGPEPVFCQFLLEKTSE